MEIRDLHLEALMIALRTGYQDFAKFFGEQSQQLKQRIASHDYKQEDQVWYESDKVIKQGREFQKWLQTKDDWFMSADGVKVKRVNGKLVKI